MEAQPRGITPIIRLLRWSLPALIATAVPAMLAHAQAPTPPPLLPSCSVPPSPGADTWPVANTDAIGSTTGTPIVFSSVTLLANDVGGPALTVTAPVNAVSSAGGTITGADPFTYTPPTAAFIGTDRFTYELVDGAGRKAIGIVRVGVIVTAPPVLVPAPDVTGATEAAATGALSAVGLTHTITRSNSASTPIGVVVSQSPTAGTPVAAGSAVNLVVSLGAQVPNLVLSAGAAAGATLATAGLTLGTVTEANHATVPAGSVISQTPLAGTNAQPGSAVAIVVSLGPSVVVMSVVPDVVSQTREAALTAITDAGLTGGAVTFAHHATMPAGNVISTSPPAGTPLAPESAVAMVVSLGVELDTEGLVVAYGFDEATGLVATDSSGVAGNGTIRGALRVAGKFGGALSFDGVNDWVTLADITASPIDLTNGMTLEAWVKPTELSDWDTIILKERGTAGMSYALYANDGSPQPSGFNAAAGYQRMANGTTDQAVRGPALALDTWTHLAVTYDGATQKLFVNGVQVASRAQTGKIAVANGALRIGGNTAWANEFYKGLIDEVRIYNRARTAEQITSDMNTPIVR
jgi:beta-lactam-binding protein with PASTA domain